MGHYTFRGGPLDGQEIAVDDRLSTYVIDGGACLDHFCRLLPGTRIHYIKRLYNTPFGEVFQFELNEPHE
jgi:hypothetical protein